MRYFVFFVLIASFLGSENQGEVSFPCTVSTVRFRSINRRFVGYGVVKPYRVITYRAPVTGRVMYFPFNEGDSVKKGTLVIRIEDSSTVYEYKGLLKEIKLLEAVSKSGIYQPDYYKKKARLYKLKRKLELMTFRAPFNGFIAGIDVRKGEIVHEGDRLFEIVFKDTFAVQVNFPALEAGLISSGLPVKVEFQNGKEVRSRVLNRKFGGDSPGVILLIPYFNSLTPGEIVRVMVFKPLKKALAIPVDALISDRTGRFHVFKVVNGRAKWVYVKPGTRGDDYVEINGGDLSPGDTVVVGGNLFLGHNTKVKIVKCID